MVPKEFTGGIHMVVHPPVYLHMDPPVVIVFVVGSVAPTDRIVLP